MVDGFLTPPCILGLQSALFIQPHPDDNEIGAGGTMIRLATQGCQVYALTVTDGRLGGDNINVSPSQLAAIRECEALAAMACIGVQNSGFLRFADQTTETVDTLAQSIAAVIDRIKPEVVFTVDPCLRDEWHDDHVKTGKAVVLALKRAQHRVNTIAYYFTDAPNTILDVSMCKEKKMEAILCHRSQISDDFLMLLENYFDATAAQSEFTAAERLRVLSRDHTHCWSLPFNVQHY